MAVQERRAEKSLDRYITDVRAAWGDGTDPQLPFKVAASMEKLFATTRADDPWMAEIIAARLPSRELYRDAELGFIQMAHVHKQGHGNAPHDHGPCWVVYGAFTGLTEITKYKRSDNGSQHGRATIVTDEVHRLSPGIVKPYLPGDIHSTHAVVGPAVVFRFLSYDLEKIERSRFNMEKGSVVTIPAS